MADRERLAQPSPGLYRCPQRPSARDMGGSSDRLRALLPKPLDCLEEAITGEAPDWKVAGKVVDLAGLNRQGTGVPNLGPSSIGPTDPEVVIETEAV